MEFFYTFAVQIIQIKLNHFHNIFKKVMGAFPTFRLILLREVGSSHLHAVSFEAFLKLQIQRKVIFQN